MSTQGASLLEGNTCLLFAHFLRLLLVLEIAVDCSNHDGLNHPF